MRRLFVILSAGLALLGACGRDKPQSVGQATSTSTTAPPAAAPAPSPPSAAAPKPRCTPADQRPPAGSVQMPEVEPTDFDGDGRPDGIYLSGGVPTKLFIAPTSGRGSHLEVPTAKPYSQMGGIDPDGDGDQELFIGIHTADEMLLQVVTFADCRVAFALNVQGQPYQFRVDPGRDGVGCVDADGDGRQDLVGLHFVHPLDRTVRWTRTIVRLEGGRAINGPTDEGTYTYPQDAERIDLLGRVTCGNKQL